MDRVFLVSNKLKDAPKISPFLDVRSPLDSAERSILVRRLSLIGGHANSIFVNGYAETVETKFQFIGYFPKFTMKEHNVLQE